MNFLVIDTETGGLDPWKHSLLTIGMLAVEDDKVVGELHISIKQDEYVVTPKAMEINQINLSDLQEHGVSRYGAVETLLAFVDAHFPGGKDTFQLMGHNLGLDRYMVQNLFKLVGVSMDQYISHRSVDTSSIIVLCKDIGLLPAELSGSLTNVYEHLYGAPRSNAHNALSDCYTTVYVYRALKSVVKGTWWPK